MSLSLTHLEPTAVLRRVGLSFLALLAFGALAVPAQARTTTLAARARTIQIAVLGDSVAHDLGRGMQDLFAKNPRIHVTLRTKFATGLVRTDYYQWDKVARDFLHHHNPDYVFVVIGGNDHQTIRRHGKRYDPDTKAWRAEYSRLVSQFMNNFARTHARVYFVSLPPVRSSRLSAAFRVINDIYRREAEQHGFHYISIWNKFLPSGSYSSFGDNLNGVERRLRMDDGEHFTEDGRLLLAHDVARAAGLR
ncbi:MAG TPA: DUF459 domain-containing protein [Pseudolabrys sp.]|nr:DUF459 domain-containing protein [Pseudolabrys sp.]